MNKLSAALLVVVLATPLTAQESDSEGFDLMKEGARLLFRGLIEEMGPALEDLQDLAEDLRPRIKDFAQEMGPALRDLMAEVDDWSLYYPPEMLPNGDIIMRRKTPEELAPQPGEEIEL
ncbi:hypothetical protein [Puniceibacterium confluentis]|uniref:hypothetical protein n=1 Tax=Puniceibacterium confluentis TaxID=1958944 RepID=UPI0011B5E44F|nr:hypothetical protein [Puniceibacterium confluentis]